MPPHIQPEVVRFTPVESKWVETQVDSGKFGASGDRVKWTEIASLGNAMCIFGKGQNTYRTSTQIAAHYKSIVKQSAMGKFATPTILDEDRLKEVPSVRHSIVTANNDLFYVSDPIAMGLPHKEAAGCPIGGWKNASAGQTFVREAEKNQRQP